jgi:molecular chaperone GrpE
MAEPTPTQEAGEPRVVVRDKRRLDPVTGEVREEVQVTGPPVTRTDPATLERELTERTDDLLRLKAEFDNYRKRVERDRGVWAEQAVARFVLELLPALDDIERARAHGELEGAFRAVADQLDKVFAAAGLERFGEVGEEFDPTRHEALSHGYSAGPLTGPTVTDVYRAGYAMNGRVLRPAQVVVAEPEPAPEPGPDAMTASYEEPPEDRPQS